MFNEKCLVVILTVKTDIHMSLNFELSFFSLTHSAELSMSKQQIFTHFVYNRRWLVGYYGFTSHSRIFHLYGDVTKYAFPSPVEE
jgi:hypothetical protein